MILNRLEQLRIIYIKGFLVCQGVFFGDSFVFFVVGCIEIGGDSGRKDHRPSSMKMMIFMDP